MVQPESTARPSCNHTVHEPRGACHHQQHNVGVRLCCHQEPWGSWAAAVAVLGSHTDSAVPLWSRNPAGYAAKLLGCSGPGKKMTGGKSLLALLKQLQMSQQRNAREPEAPHWEERVCVEEMGFPP